MHRVPTLDASKTLLFLRDSTAITRRDDPRGPLTVIRSPEPDDLALLVDAVDGVRTLAEICTHLDEIFDAEDVLHAFEALDGVIFLLTTPAAVSEPPPGEVTVVGGGRLAVQLARALVASGVDSARLLWVGTESPPTAVDGVDVEVVADSGLVDRLRGVPAIIAAHSETTLARAIELNRAALAANVFCVHVLAEDDAIVVGPTTVPYRTACFECSQIGWYFENHPADHAPTAFGRVRVGQIGDPQLEAALIADAAKRVGAELGGLLSGQSWPALLGSQVRVSLAAGTEVAELVPTTNCESCHGCNRDGIGLGVSVDAIPELPGLDRSIELIEDHAGGVRSVAPTEARRRAEAALSYLGVDLGSRGYSKKVRTRYPELEEVPFLSMVPRLTFRPDSETIIARPPRRCYGKGPDPRQATCSGMFEFLERTFMMYRGQVEIVRAPYASVRDYAIDMDYFTDGMLDIPDGGPRVWFDPSIEIDWCWARCLRRDRPILVPAQSLFLGAYDEARFPMSSFRGGHIEFPWRGSSGLSAGATREDAVLQGLYEVIEHDARVVQNRTGIVAPAIELDSIDDPIARGLIEKMRSAGCDLVLRYLTRDIEIPVVEAFATSKRDMTFFRVPGWGCHHDPAIAISRAVAETAQGIGASESVASQTFRGGMYAITNSFRESRYGVDRTEGAVAFSDLPRADPSWRSAVDYLDAAVESMVEALPQLDICFFEYPTPGVEGINVVRVFATGVYNSLLQTRHFPDRLLDPNRFTGSSQPLTLADLYLGDLKI